MENKIKKFEENLSALNEVVIALENGELSLEESLTKFEEGIKFYKECQLSLKESESKVNLIIEDLIEGGFIKSDFYGDT